MLLHDANVPQLLFPKGLRASLFMDLGELQKVHKRKLAGGGGLRCHCLALGILRMLNL